MENQILFMIMGVICLIIIVMLLQMNSIQNEDDTNNEHFDARIKGITKEKCGEVCTAILKCQGFAYSNDNACYLSKSPILEKPVLSVFSDDYSPTFYRCNKTQPIMDETDLITPDLLRRNSLYMCSDSEQGKYDINIISENLRQSIGDFDEIDKIDVPKYKIITNFRWPTDKRDSLLRDTTTGDNFKIFEKSNNEFLGQYLFPHKCVSNISEISCLKMCEVDDKCIGVEWNPFYMKTKPNNSFDLYKNVCCPKTEISDIIPRKEFENGNFYSKKLVDELNKNLTYIVTKEDT